MSDRFEQAMQEAAWLTRSGRLQEATDLIRGALAPQPSGIVAEDVIDVQARVLDEGPAEEAAAAQTDERAESFEPGHFRNAAGARDFKLYIPPARPSMPAAGRALIVMLHGCTQDPDDFARGTRMNAAAREHGALVLYPAQSRRANPQGCWNWFKHSHQQRGRGEAGLLEGMVREVVRRHDVDPARVFVAGLSAGAAMAAIVAETCPDLFAAVGVHSGLAAGAANDLPSALAAMNGTAPATRGAATALPTIVFHGDADATVHPRNAEYVVQAAGGRGPGSVERGETGGRRWTKRVFDAGRIEQWVVHGAGHAWSGGDALGSHADRAGPDASGEMLRFFLAHPKASG